MEILQHKFCNKNRVMKISYSSYSSDSSDSSDSIASSDGSDSSKAKKNFFKKKLFFNERKKIHQEKFKKRILPEKNFTKKICYNFFLLDFVQQKNVFIRKLFLLLKNLFKKKFTQPLHKEN